MRVSGQRLGNVRADVKGTSHRREPRHRSPFRSTLRGRRLGPRSVERTSRVPGCSSNTREPSSSSRCTYEGRSPPAPLCSHGRKAAARGSGRTDASGVGLHGGLMQPGDPLACVRRIPGVRGAPAGPGASAVACPQSEETDARELIFQSINFTENNIPFSCFFLFYFLRLPRERLPGFASRPGPGS